MRIAYLACASTLPGSKQRRADAFEHDQMAQCLGDAFRAEGSEIVEVRWDDATIDWSDFDAALIGSTWDYQDRLDEFLEKLAAIERQIPLFNTSSLVRWNARKTYLRDLEARGAPVIPTVWIDKPDDAEVTAAFERLGADDVVFKRQIGANAEGQHRLRQGDTPPPMRHPMMAQPFLPAIEREGEISFIFVDCEFSHAAIKRAADGDYRIQSSYGGREQDFAPTSDDLAAARKALSAVDGDPLYARVDMVRGDNGALLLMEFELIEPFLYPLQAHDLGKRLHAALERRLN